MIDAYLDEFYRWTAGSKAERKERREELRSHLMAALQAGRVDEVMAGFGTPRDAARAFAHAPPAASLVRRVLAITLDYSIFAAALLLIAPAPDSEPTPQLIVSVIGTILGWFFLWLLMEWRTGRTPGKTAFGLRAVSEDGTALSFSQAVLRRLPLVFSGPLQVIDWAFVFFNPQRQRAFDKVAGTMVMEAPLRSGHQAQVMHPSSV